MSDPVNSPSPDEQMHAAALARHMAELETLQKRHAQMTVAYNKLGDEGTDLELAYLAMDLTPDPQKQNAEKLDQMAKQLHEMQGRLDRMYDEMEACLSEIEQTKKTLSDLQLKPDKSFRLEKEEDLGIDFEAIDKLAEDSDYQMRTAAKNLRNRWDGYNTPDEYFDGHVKGQKDILKSWEQQKLKNETLGQTLRDRRDKLGSNPLKKVWNWKEISELNSTIKDIPGWQKHLDVAMQDTQKDLQKVERERERYHKNVAQLKEQKAEESLAKAQKSEVALKSEDDLGIDFQALSKLGKESEGQLGQMNVESQRNHLTGELERLKKGQSTMENAFNDTDKRWAELENQRKQLSSNPISRYRNKEQLKEIGEELDIVVPQWYALQGGKIKYQAEITKTEQALAACEKQIEQGQLQQQSQQPSVRQTTHIHEGQQGTSENLHQGVSEKTVPKVGGNVGTSIHVNHNGHGDPSEGQGPKLSPTNPYAQHVNGPKR
ncbi:hypothetical protein [Roseimicrobium sp. ORNL1]|uniref:hypothetical protein n=1 Tax=Roseimicrobium sp. ORNL1 TaxID=2711231 RepID=UPI0013E10CF4|nr:hypothetical protein [Roseimicrobium sp. ORNL1]QIF02149.1 hypothetical protein G5S37_11600 [Roseimicrobium sp. ORNL1]